MLVQPLEEVVNSQVVNVTSDPTSSGSRRPGMSRQVHAMLFTIAYTYRSSSELGVGVASLKASCDIFESMINEYLVRVFFFGICRPFHITLLRKSACVYVDIPNISVIRRYGFVMILHFLWHSPSGTGCG